MRTDRWLAAIVVALSSRLLCAQAATVTPLQQSITVLGAPEPITEGESARSVALIDLQTLPVLNIDPIDALRIDSSVDIQTRGPMGVMSDISLRGTSFEQTLVLLNGFRIDDVETAHFNLDIPVPLAALSGVDVLHGAGSTLYGSDALGGVVDFTTTAPTETGLRLRAGVGSYGINEQVVTTTLVHDTFSDVLAGERDFSTGFIADRDYRSEEVSNELRAHSILGDTDVLLAGSDRAFGADQFYGDYNSYERTKGWYGFGTQSFDPKTQMDFGYRRHSDEFILLRDDPAVYENNHIVQSWQGVLRRHDDLGSHAHIFYGLEENADEIASNSLGHHGRNRTAGYADADFRWHRFSASAALREEVLSGGTVVSAPGFSAAFWATDKLKLRGAAGYGYRLPTFDDLYYSDPTSLGNPGLKPESAWNYEGGVDWYARRNIELSVTGFASPQKHAIDYVRAIGAPPTTQYQAENLTNFTYSGVEAAVRAALPHNAQLRLSWTFLHGTKDALNGLESRYLFNSPTNNAAADYTVRTHNIAFNARLNVTQRFQQTAYPTLQLSATRDTGLIRPYIQMTNLTNTGYEEIQGVRMQGRAFIGGVEIVLPAHHL